MFMTWKCCQASLIGDYHERGVTFRQNENTDELRRKLDNGLKGIKFR